MPSPPIVKDDPANRPRPIPGKGWYLLGSAFLIAGVVIGAIVIIVNIQGLLNANDALQRFTIPGRSLLHLTERSSYTIFHEHKSHIDDETIDTEARDLSKFDFTLHPVDKPDQPIALRPVSGTATYNLSSREGEAILKFSVETPGEYIFEAQIADEQATPDGPVVFAVAGGFVTEMFKQIGLLLCGGLFLLLFVTIGTIIIVVTFVKRRPRHPPKISA